MARMLSMDANDVKNTDDVGAKMPANWRLLALVIFFFFYLALGASIFSAIESPIEQEEIRSVLSSKHDFLDRHSCITESTLDELIEKIVSANNRGVSVGPNGSSVSSWTFGQSFFFSSTVVTTIGYGHQTPLSSEGKVFCMIYALIGIPMTLLLLTAIVERLIYPLAIFLGFLNRKLSHIYGPLTIRLIHLAIIVTVVIIFFFLIPAALFASIETNWNYLDSLYYCFISLTTIGLGDFIPGDSPDQKWRPLYKACTTVYLLVGVTLMMLTMSVIYSIPELDASDLFLMKCTSNRAGHLMTSASQPSQPAHASDPERIRLQSGGPAGPLYTQQHNDQETQRTVVRARSRLNDDSPSPVEADPPQPDRSGRVRLH